jgi:hypothetical protein
LQSRVRTVGVVPADGALHSQLERATPQRHDGPEKQAFLQGTDETFHHGDAAALADSAETLVDGVAATPLLQAMVTEFSTVVGQRAATNSRSQRTWARS